MTQTSDSPELTQVAQVNEVVSQNIFGSDQIWLIMDQWGILLGLIGILYGVFTKIKIGKIRAGLTRNRFPHVGETVTECPRSKGLVFTISNMDVPQWVVQQCGAEQVGLVSTEQSRKAADQLKAIWSNEGKTVYGPVEIGDPDDPMQSRNEVAHLLRTMALAANEVAVDVTGGKVPMSLGAFMAAEEAGVRTFYVTTQYDPTLKKPNINTASLRLISRPENQ